MFRKACALASQFTRPVILSRKTIEGRCSSAIGAFVVVNAEGWIVTASHIVDQFSTLASEARAARDVENTRRALETDPALDEREKRRRLGRVTKLPKDRTDRCSAWWSFPSQTELVDAVGIQGVDLAVGRLDPFDPTWIPTYPLFKDHSKNFDSGTSLCKLGFPFHSIEPTWNSSTNTFELPTGALPIPFFPLEGIFTRTGEIVIQPPPSSPLPYPLRWVETSTPGLRGQSGGPTFDTEGTVWAIQCRTAHLPLGFSPSVPGGREEHQFLNVGLGVHPVTIFGLFNELGIKFQVSSY